MTQSLDLRDRDIRQRDLVPGDRLGTCHAVVIGVGAIGRQTALQLAALGIPRLTLVDHDTVSVENLAVQAYWPTDVGNAKINATKSVCAQINPHCEIIAVPERFRASQLRHARSTERLIVFACVDSIRTRRLIWEGIRHRCSLFIDGRMSAEVLRVLVAERPATNTDYEETLFDASEAFSGSCTSRSTIYTASIAAGLMIGQFTKWLRGLPVDADVTLNLLSMELGVGNPVPA